MVSLEQIRWRSADRGGQDSRRGEEAGPSQASLAGARDTKPDERDKVAGEEREHCTPPRRATGRLRGPEDRRPGAPCVWAGRWGPDVPGPHGRAGEAGPPALLAGPLGETPGSPTLAMPLQSMAQQAKHDPAMVCNTVGHLMAQECR